MINYAAGLQHYYFPLSDLNTIYTGRIAEHIVGQELLANNHLINDELKFWVREKVQSNAEVDYVIPFDRYIIPIEVKSGKTGKLKSLQQFMELSDHTYAVRFYSGKIQKDILRTPSGKIFTLLNLPYYLVSQLRTYLNELIQP
jgi:predicted AAA+ superfamily ATPase